VIRAAQFTPPVPERSLSPVNPGLSIVPAPETATGFQITSPAPLADLRDKQPHGPKMFNYEVRGRLNQLPADHEIWLLTEERSGEVRPHGFYAVQFDPQNGEWLGRIGSSPGQPIKIVAVVTPPASQDFFKYYQRVGRKTDFEALIRVPPDCKNRVSVQARAP